MTSEKAKTSDEGFEGVGHEWEATDLRHRARSGDGLLVWPEGPDKNAYVAKTVGNVRLNAQVLSPVLGRIAALKGRPLPSIQAMMTEVVAFYTKCQINTSAALNYQQAWAIRRLLQLVKSCAFRPSPPQADL